MISGARARCSSFVTSGTSILRNSSSFNRNRKYYELTVDEDENEIRNQPNPLADVERRINESKEKMKWRTPPPNQFKYTYDLLSMFSRERQRAEHLQRIAKPLKFNLPWKEYLKQFKLRQEDTEAMLQSFIPQRHQILGNNLAAAHFLIHRGAEIRFTKSPEWQKRDKYKEYDLPPRFHPDYIIDGIKCDGMDLYYEGLENVRRLYELKTFSLKNVRHFDDWCLDRVAGSQFEKLEVLDISGTKITANGLVAIPKIPSLKLLILSDIKRSTAFELSLLMLEDIMPNLEIREPEATEEVSAKPSD